LNILLIKIQELLARSSKERVDIPDDIIEEFGEACKQAFKKQFTEERDKNFSIRMSSIGKPLCQTFLLECLVLANHYANYKWKSIILLQKNPLTILK
jgi:hypothetical protein